MKLIFAGDFICFLGVLLAELTALVSASDHYKIGTLNQVETFPVRRGQDLHLTYNSQKSEEISSLYNNNVLWTISIEVVGEGNEPSIAGTGTNEPSIAGTGTNEPSMAGTGTNQPSIMENERAGSRGSPSSRVHVVVRQAEQVKSFELPQQYEDREKTFTFTTRKFVTDICPFDVKPNSTLSIAVSTYSQVDVNMEILVDVKPAAVWRDWYTASENNAVLTTATLQLGNPVVRYVAGLGNGVVGLDNGVAGRGNGIVDLNNGSLYKVDLEVSQDSDCLCSIVSIQDATCPYHDRLDLIMRYGEWQTMLSRSAFVVDPKDYPKGFLIVVVASPTDKLCNIKQENNKCNNINGDKNTEELRKNLNIRISINSRTSDYVFGILLIVGGYILLIVISLIISIIRFTYDIDGFEEIKDVIQEKYTPSQSEASEYMEELWNSTSKGVSKLKDVMNTESKDNSNTKSNPKLGSKVIRRKPSTDIHELPEILSKEAYIESLSYRLKKDLKVSKISEKVCDPSKKKSIYQKSTMYIGNLGLMSLFYCLPVLQMAMDAHSQIDETGNQDLCYFNHLCQKPLGPLKDFNHVFSNLGYIMFGLLFIGIVYLKKSRFRKLSADCKHNFGIPQQFGLYFSMGLAVMMEGILSGCYHICPSTITFQFDTTFMYLMAILMFLQLYQNRHPDISCNAHKAFFGLGIALILEAISIYYHGPIFWIVFCICYFIFILIIGAHVYSMGIIRHDHKIFWSILILVVGGIKKLYLKATCRREQGYEAITPETSDYSSPSIEVNNREEPKIRYRIVFLILLTLFNIIFCLYIIIMEMKNYASDYLLYIFMGNMFAYLVYYIMMKLLSGEKPTWESWIYFICGILAAAPALYLFTQKEKSTDLSPAESRALNKDCIFLNFYDGHDVWHFLGSCGIFFMFMFLLTIDEDLKYTKRDLIYVF